MNPFARRIEKLEAGHRPDDPDGFDAMGIVELQDYIRKKLEALGGREAVLLAMRAAGLDADTIKLVEYWTNGICD